MRFLFAVVAAVGCPQSASTQDNSKSDTQYPFRTDAANAHLPWYRPKAAAFPPNHSAHRIDGVLVAVDFIHRQGQFRTSTGELCHFTLPPNGVVSYLNADADLRDVPLGRPYQFFLHQDAAGEFSRVALMRDHASAIASDSFALRVASAWQQQRHAAFIKDRGIAGWVEKTEGVTLTITLFGGDKEAFEKTWLKDFIAGRDVHVVVANDELRTWNPPVDQERAKLVEVQKIATDAYGHSGVRLVITVKYMLEGFRRGRVVRVFGPGWKSKDQPYGESLMGYGYERLKTREIVELVPKEYPEQFPFRTDYSNAHLPWYQLKAGVVPPPFAEHRVFGELVSVDAATRSGRFRTDRSDKLVDFWLIPEGSVRFLNAPATLADLSVGTRCHFHLYQDDKGEFTRVDFVSDEFSYLASNAITWRVDSFNRERGELFVARQIPSVKDYNGDPFQPPDIGRAILRVDATTRVWKLDQQAKLEDIAAGDALLVNLTGERPGHPSRCSDLWIGADTHKLVAEQQAKKATPPKK